ncbi:cytochrome c [Archangium violaceum]|uniref:c-type cytochrome n=1 Tax=Archangium violaceum TaxID=83451 RepID=UPI00193AF651|nr:cytochrome c [Archangium violaceum]QRK11727.1 cytochrome c [Archangium violaceum]
MSKRPSSKPPSVPLTRTALLSMALTLSACPDKQEKAPSAPSAATVFKDSPSAEAPPSPSEGTPTAPQGGTQQVPANTARTPEQLFSSLGCRACHGPGTAFAPVLANSRDKPAEVVAMWILDPQKIRPGTMMPSFAGRISTSEALALAQWIKAGNPAPANTP